MKTKGIIVINKGYFLRYKINSKVYELMTSCLEKYKLVALFSVDSV